ncbi:MAG: SDR family NAD(P)-dependent oxidoreductase [Candidatus Lokiarchaeota archaeon]|nr:SDR family NAD(P)-dependent oxidoreductase [Candidatus Lokiarchaeota archaeon]MBD3201852.1 SDR family NAD(P)-dependent oxidoreductase [Candidatus Lokiarchaeota archaeon]
MEDEVEEEEIYKTDLNDKIFIVTGANSGIGKEITRGLAKMNAKVVMVCRSKERGTTTMNQIKKNIPNGNLDLMICDLSDFSQIRDFANKFKKKFPKLDGLINNAGIYLGDYKESVDGISLMMQVNHFSPFLLTHLLLDSLKKSDFSRIINVNSGAHHSGEIEISEASKIKKWKKAGMKGYSVSKFVNLLTIYRFSSRKPCPLGHG